MKYHDLANLVSQPRLDRYLAACVNSKVKAQKLYKANLRVAQAFYPLLNLFEIILRNKIHYRLSAHFANPDWIVVERMGFMSDNSLRGSNFFLKNQIEKAERKLRRRGSRITAGKVIAEQTFGFWTSLFDPHHYRLLRGSIINCFPNKLTTVNRSEISVKLQRIRDFRNRIYHNEPICFDRNQINFRIAEDIKNDIYDLLE
ncbi:MAG: hypothetical protein AB8G15_07335 [Saprospiraceae bacterium]